MIQQGLSTLHSVAPLIQSGAQKGAAIATLKHAANAICTLAPVIPQHKLPLIAGTTAASIHAATKISDGLPSVYKDASASMTAVIAGHLVSKTNLPQPAKTAIIYGMTGMVMALQDRTKANPKLGLILVSFYIGHKLLTKLCPNIQKVFLNTTTEKSETR